MSTLRNLEVARSMNFSSHQQLCYVAGEWKPALDAVTMTLQLRISSSPFGTERRFGQSLSPQGRVPRLASLAADPGEGAGFLFADWACVRWAMQEGRPFLEDTRRHRRDWRSVSSTPNSGAGSSR